MKTLDVFFFPTELDVFESTKTSSSSSRNPFKALNHIQGSLTVLEKKNGALMVP